jgi:hypothetical protein
MKGIFISYRREDSAPYAGRLCDHLRRTFPSTSVFMDVNAVTPGADFVNAIDANLSESAVVLAVIGPQWESIKDRDGHRRIENPDDYVAHELSTALERQANVIPLLVGGAKMPSATSLPSKLEGLSRRNAIEISDTRFAADAERLCAAISSILGIPHDDQQSSSRVEYSQFFSDAALAKARSKFRLVVWINYALSVLLILFAQLWSNVNPEVSSSESTLNVELPCKDATTTDLDYVLCRAVSAAMNVNTKTLDGIADMIAIALSLFLLCFWALVNLKVLRGKGWARIAFVTLGGFVILSAFEVAIFNRLHGALYVAQVALYIATVISYGWAVRAMFTEPVRRWFLRA